MCKHGTRCNETEGRQGKAGRQHTANILRAAKKSIIGATAHRPRRRGKIVRQRRCGFPAIRLGNSGEDEFGRSKTPRGPTDQARGTASATDGRGTCIVAGLAAAKVGRDGCRGILADGGGGK